MSIAMSNSPILGQLEDFHQQPTPRYFQNRAVGHGFDLDQICWARQQRASEACELVRSCRG